MRTLRLTRLRTKGLALLKVRSQGKPTQDEGDDAGPHELDSRAAWDSLAVDIESPYLEDSGFRSIYEGFCGRLPQSASVLDLGCGSGVPFDQDLVDRGFQVTGVDFSPAMIEAARRNCPSARFICMSMTDIAFESTFDALIAVSSMLCLRPDEFRATAVAISNALKPHGQLLLTLNEPKGPVDQAPKDDATTHSLSGRKLYARAYTEDEVRQAFAGLGMQIESVDRQVIESQPYGREHVIAFVMTKNLSRRDGLSKTTASDPSPEMSQQLELRDEVLKEQDRFLQRHGYPLNLVSPRSFSEKVCWRKLFDRNPLFPVVADKYRVREFVEVMLGPEDAKRYLVPLLFETRDPAAIPFDQLPSEYVIKMNHGYRMNFIIREGCEVPNEEIIDRCREWMNSDFSLRHNEWAYSQIDRRIIGEELFAGEEGRPPRDVKLHMFDGKCELIQVVASDAWYDGHTIDSGHLVTQTYYTPDWQEVKPMHGRVSAPDDEPPDELEEITQLARRLSTPFDYMRVDVYLTAGDIRFGELTMYPDAGKGRFATAELDFEMGRLWRLPAQGRPNSRSNHFGLRNRYGHRGGAGDGPDAV